MSAWVKIAEVTRGSAVESVHHGAAAVVDADGRLIASAGDPGLVTYSRSSLKPFQATPTIARGAIDTFALQLRHVALMCGSHNGEPRHVQAAAEILAAIGCSEFDLNCGVHVPYLYSVCGQTPPPEMKFTQVHNNCSGKHSGMLALCRLLGAPLVGYLEVNHPAQVAIRQLVHHATGLSDDQLTLGIDGCNAPTYAMPLYALAGAYARLAFSRGPDENSSQAMQTIVHAMQAEPAMVSGENRLDLALAEIAPDRLICKVGGEAIECMALTDRGWGIVVKVADGALRALGVAAVEILRQLDVLSDAEVEQLRSHARPYATNHRRVIVGEIRPTINLIHHVV